MSSLMAKINLPDTRSTLTAEAEARAENERSSTTAETSDERYFSS